MIEIETPRLLLRRWRELDLDVFAQMNADIDVMRYFPAPLGTEQTKNFFDAIQQEFSERGYGLYAVEEKNSSRFMGFIGFHWAELAVDFCPCVEIGWRLDKRFWNKGYATEGATACLEYGFNRLNLDRICSFTAIANLPSQRIMQKIGMQLHCFFEHPKISEDHPLKPHVCYLSERK